MYSLLLNLIYNSLPISTITPNFREAITKSYYRNVTSLFIPTKGYSLVFHILHDLFCKCDRIRVYIHC